MENIVFAFYGQLRFFGLTIENIIATIEKYSKKSNIYLIFDISLKITASPMQIKNKEYLKNLKEHSVETHNRFEHYLKLIRTRIPTINIYTTINQHDDKEYPKMPFYKIYDYKFSIIEQIKKIVIEKKISISKIVITRPDKIFTKLDLDKLNVNEFSVFWDYLLIFEGRTLEKLHKSYFMEFLKYKISVAEAQSMPSGKRMSPLDILYHICFDEFLKEKLKLKFNSDICLIEHLFLLPSADK